MLSETGRMGVRLVAASNLAVIWLVTSVYMTVFFPVTGVGKPSIAAFELAAERFLSCKRNAN